MWIPTLHAHNVIPDRIRWGRPFSSEFSHVMWAQHLKSKPPFQQAFPSSNKHMKWMTGFSSKTVKILLQSEPGCKGLSPTTNKITVLRSVPYSFWLINLPWSRGMSFNPHQLEFPRCEGGITTITQISALHKSQRIKAMTSECLECL